MLTPLISVVPALLGAFFAIAPPAHPHYPKAIAVGGAAGTVKVLYFTVPYNPEQLKRNAKPGFSWHLGFSLLDTQVPLKVGSTTIPKGKYKLNAKMGDKEGDWSFELSSFAVMEAQMQMRIAQRRARRGGDAAAQAVDAARKKLADAREAAADMKPITLAAKPFKMVHEEHLTMTAIVSGYNTAQRMSDEPAGGAEFALRISFGDLHREVEFAEVFGDGKDK